MQIETILSDLKKFLADKKFLRNKTLIWRVIIISAVIVGLAQFRGCVLSRRGTAMPPRPVQTAVAAEKDVPVYLNSFGTLAPLSSVNIKSQVTGEVKEIHFKGGNTVKKGDLLYVIDPDQYKASVEKAEAALEEDLSSLQLKQDTLDRNKQLFDKQLVSQQNYDKLKNDVAVAKAQVDIDKSSLKTAKIDLDYCYIKAPVTGIAGKGQVDAGNIVSANSGPTLVNIKTIDPLYVDFTIPERDLPKLRRSMSDNVLDVEITVDGDDGGPYKGTLDFLDNTVDQSTGTVSLRAIVPNTEGHLWPGQFVQVKLILRIEKNAVVVPYEAVQLGRKGSYLFVVGPKGKADLRMVETGSRDGDLIVIKNDVTAGETVVTVGQMGLAPGASTVDVTQPENGDKGKSAAK